jgi:hypothetical protein
MRSLNPVVSEIRDLTESEAKKVLSRNHVGRIAFSFHDRVDIRPIGYVFRDGWLFFRTSPGEKLVTMRHNPWVAFEVDEIHDRLNWASVVVRGALYELDEDGSEFHRRARDFAIRLLRTVEPSALTPDDSTPSRTRIFGISVHVVTGRQCTSSVRFDRIQRLGQRA